jgi:hypothetical protein
MPHELNGRGMEDPRGLLEKLRRHELESVLAAEGIHHPSDIPAFSARYLLATNGIDVAKYVNGGRFIAPKATAAIDVNEMKMPELRQYCAKAGIPWSVSDKKTDLQAKIQESLA